MGNDSTAGESSAVEKFILENGVLKVKTNLYPYLMREFESLCDRLLKFPNEELVIDMTECGFVSTVFLSALIKTHLKAQRQSRKLLILIGRDLEQFFVYASLDKTFNIKKQEPDQPSGT